MKNYKYILEGLDCANCAKIIENRIAATEGYKNVNVNFSTLKLSFQSDKQNVKKEICSIVKSVEPDVIVREESEKSDTKTERSSLDIIRLILGVAIYFIAMFLNLGTNIQILATIISLSILLIKVFKKALTQIFENKVLDENTLITISAIGACLVGKSMEGIMVVTLYEIGKILESKAVNKTRKSISQLMDIKPEYAYLKNKEEIRQVKPEDVNIGNIIIVKVGDKIPLDGTVISGNAEIDNSALTGESALVKAEKGDKVLSGGINVQGLLEIRVDKIYENSTVNQILNLVENATDKKAKTETFVAKAAKIYTPTVLVLAILVAVFMPLLFKEVTYSESIYKALIFLVISCPCSIAISVPLSYFSGIGKASKKGILIKGSDYLGSLKDINEIIFDKTGTITTGDFSISKVEVLDNNYTEDKILDYLIMGEKFSNHPIAKSILKIAKKELDTSKVENFKEIVGKGLQYQYAGKIIKIGNKEILEGIQDKGFIENNETELYLVIDDELVGKIILVDEIKNDAKITIKKLEKLGIKTKMFTGDKQKVANIIADQIGIKEVKAEMLPQDKHNELETVLKNNKTGKVAYVGDGINDSPVLARADIGISMGGIGTSSAIEASDVVIMTDELNKLLEAISISKRTNKIVKQNLIFAIGVKLLILLLSLLGASDMWEAVFADVGATLITIFNTIRILNKSYKFNSYCHRI